jgi:hypothetical protein
LYYLYSIKQAEIWRFVSHFPLEAPRISFALTSRESSVFINKYIKDNSKNLTLVPCDSSPNPDEVEVEDTGDYRRQFGRNKISHKIHPKHDKGIINLFM